MAGEGDFSLEEPMDEGWKCHSAGETSEKDDSTSQQSS